MRREGKEKGWGWGEEEDAEEDGEEEISGCEKVGASE